MMDVHSSTKRPRPSRNEQAAIRNDHMFEMLMVPTKYSSLRQLTAAIPLRRDRLFEVEEQYRTNM